MTEIFSDISEIADAVAGILSDLIAVPDERTIHIALSGGNTPKIIFKYLAENYGNKFADRRIHYWWGDERCVPPTDDDSNYKWANNLWLSPVGVAKQNIHRIKGENNCCEEVLVYTDEIKKVVPFKNGFPCFDLILLGLGDDGHTASIFPDRIGELLDSFQLCECVEYPGTGKHRITLTGKVLNNARKLVFIVTGANKDLIVRDVVAFSNPSYPASHIKPADGEVIWLLDKGSARLL